MPTATINLYKEMRNKGREVFLVVSLDRMYIVRK
jgi:hypothetical protein